MADSTDITPVQETPNTEPSPMQPAPAVSTPQPSPDQFVSSMAGLGAAPQSTAVDVAGTAPKVSTQGPGATQQPSTAIAQGSAGMPQNVPFIKQDHDSMFHTLFQSLAGGPRTSYKINANTGEMEKTEAPLGKGGIMAGILAGAVTGMMQSAKEKGLGAAATAGFNAGQDRIHNQQKTQKDEASADYRRSQDAQASKLSTLDTNLKMHAIAVGLGQKGQEANQANVDSHADTFDIIAKNTPEAIQADMVPHDQLLSKYNVTDDMAIPRKVVARMDPETGKQAEDSYGTPLWDTLYAVVKPDAVVPLNKDVLAKAAYWSQPGTVNSKGAPINSAEGTALKIKTQLAMQARNSSLDSMAQDLKVMNPKVDLAAEIKKDPSLADAIGKFQGSLAHGGDTMAGIDEVKKKDMTAGMKLEQLFGGREALIKTSEEKKQADLERTEDIKGRHSAEVYGQKLKMKQENEDAEIAKIYTPQGLDQAALIYGKGGGMPAGTRNPKVSAMIANRFAEMTNGTGRPADWDNIPDVAGNKQLMQANDVSRKNLQKQADVIGAFENTAKANLNTFLGTAQNLVDLKSPLLNKPVREIDQAMGGADFPVFNAARTMALTEIAKVLSSASGNGVLSDSQRKEINELIPANANLKQITQAAKILVKDMDARKASNTKELQEIQDRSSAIGKQAAKHYAAAGGDPSLLSSEAVQHHGGQVAPTAPVQAPQGASQEVMVNGKLAGHIVNGVYKALGGQ